MSEKTKSPSIIKDAFILFIITLVAALLLSFVNEITKGPIAEREAKEKAKAYQKVFEDADSIDMEDKLIIDKLLISRELLSSASLSKVVIEEAGFVKDAGENIIGCVMTITSPNGYNGDITITMGYTIDKKVTNIEFLTLNETAGFGLNAKEPSYKNQFMDINGENTFTQSSIEGISGATITSDAVLEAVNAGIVFAADLLDSVQGGGN